LENAQELVKNGMMKHGLIVVERKTMTIVYASRLAGELFAPKKIIEGAPLSDVLEEKQIQRLMGTSGEDLIESESDKILKVSVVKTEKIVVLGVEDCTQTFRLEEENKYLALMNQQLREVPAYDKTIMQLGSAALAMLPYVLLTVDLPAQSMAAGTLGMALLVGVIHTGVAYWLYFGCMSELPAQTVALLSYMDPVVAILLSALLLGEPLTLMTGLGAVLVLGATVVSEVSGE